MAIVPIALSVAGSDSGGGAGIQADLRVFHAHGVFGTTAITAVTAQNFHTVTQVEGLPAPSVRAQIAAVLAGFSLTAAKTGMLWSRDIVEVVAATLPRGLPLVVDPVMVATSGARLLDRDGVSAYRQLLCPRASVVTPNLDEAAVFLGVDRIAPAEQPAAAAALAQELGCAVLLKGGHLCGDPVDVLHHAGGTAAWTHARVSLVDTHGSGCMLSAALAAGLARGLALEGACEEALTFVHRALSLARPLGPSLHVADIERASSGSSPGPLRRLF